METHITKISNKALITIVIFVGIVAVALSTATLILYSRQQDAITAARQAEYRICQRQMINRATLNIDDELRRLRDLPLYDCTHNLTGHPAHRLTKPAEEALERFVRTAPTSELP